MKNRHPFVIDAMVVLPDHLHAMWTLPQNDPDYSPRWMLTKGGFSRRISKDDRIKPSRIKKDERGIWQRRFWDTNFSYIDKETQEEYFVGLPEEKGSNLIENSQ